MHISILAVKFKMMVVPGIAVGTRSGHGGYLINPMIGAIVYNIVHLKVPKWSSALWPCEGRKIADAGRNNFIGALNFG